MQTFDLGDMDRQELETLKSEIDKTLKTLETRRRDEALAAAREAALEYGFKLEDIHAAGSGTRSGKSKRPPKYRDPESGKTWSGIGRKPFWILEAEEAGTDIDAYLI